MVGIEDHRSDDALGSGRPVAPGSDGSLRRRTLAAAAILTGGWYLVWRLGWTLGAPWWLSIPLLAAEAVLFVRFALGVVVTLPEPDGDDPAVAAGAVSEPTGVELLVPAGHADRDALTRTLATAVHGTGSVTSDVRIRVLDHRSRSGIRREAERLGATYEVHPVDPAAGPAALVEAARPTVATEAFAWVDAGDVVVPGFGDLAALLVDPTRPRVAVVQSSTDLVNSDSLLHLVPDRDEAAVLNRVAGPSLSRSGCAPWTGSGSICRADAIGEIGGIPAGADATRRAAVRLDRAGWATRWSNPALVRSSAPDTLAELLCDAGTTAHDDWVALAGADSVLLPARLHVRRRAEQLRASTAVLDGVARLVLFGVLVATLVTGRLPIVAPLATFSALFVVQLVARVAATIALGRGAVGFGDVTRRGLRLMGVHVTGLVRSPRGTGSDAKGGVAVLGQLRLLCAALVAVDLALAARGLALFVDGLLPSFDRSGQFLAVVAAVWAIIATIDVLQLLVGRVQRRGVHRAHAELVATVDGVRCRVVDLTPKGVGLLFPSPDGLADGRVRIHLDVPRLDGTMTEVAASARLRHVSDVVDPGSGYFRAGASFGNLDGPARDALVEFCALTAEQRDGARTVVARRAPEDLEVAGGSRPRRALAGASVAALLVAGVVVAGSPAGASPGTGSIAGRVLDAAGSPLTGCVDVAQGPSWGSTVTGPDGSFVIDGLSDGTYVVRATDCGTGASVPTYSGSVIWSEDAQQVVVSGAGSASVGDVRLYPAGTLRGTVLDDAAAPAADVCVGMTVDVGGSERWWWLAQSGPDGTWQGTAPAGVTGVLNLYDCAAVHRFVTTWSPGVATKAQATPFSVTGGAATDVGSTTMIRGAVVEGTVTGADGSPMPNVCVSAQDTTSGDSWQWMGGSSSGPDGTYRFVVAPGTYSLWFSDCGSGLDVIPKWYPDSPSNTRPEPTVSIALPGGRYDMAMDLGGRVTGTLIDDTGAPVTDACVGLRSADSPEETRSWDRVQTDGTWTSAPVAAGDYLVEYRTCKGSNWTDDGTWVRELRSDVYPDGPDPWSVDDAQPVSVVAGQTTTGIDDDLLRGVRVAGRVTTGDGALGVRGICVGGVEGNDGDRRTAADGTWSSSILPGRPTTITFTDCEPGRGFVQQSRVVQGAPGQEIELDVDLSTGPVNSVTGLVRNAAGHAPSGTCVVAYVPNNIVGMSGLQADGSFSIDGLGDGDYWMAAFGCGGDEDISGMVDPDDSSVVYPPTWYPDVPIEMVSNRSPVPAEQGVPPTEVRSSSPTAPIDFCLGAGCVRAPVTTTTPPQTTVPPTTVAPVGSLPTTTAPVTVPPTTAPPSSEPARPVLPASAGTGRRGDGGTVFGGPVWMRGAARRMAPTVPGSAPTAGMAKLQDEAAESSDRPSAVAPATAQAGPSTAPGFAPSAPEVEGPDPVLSANGDPVSREERAASSSGEGVDLAWDLFGGVALVAAAAIALVLVWRRRHPGY